MPITIEQIDVWRSVSSEHQRLEFKEAKNQFDNTKLYKYCVAIANEGGGHLLLGIKNDPPRSVVGTASFNNPIEMSEKLFQTLGFRVDIEEVLHPDGRVLVFQIPSRPHGTAYNLEGAYWMRSGESLVPMSEDQLRQIFNEGKPDWLEEYSKSGLTASEVVELLDTQTYFELLASPYPRDRSGVIERLKSDHLIEEIDGLYAIKRIGALLLAKSINDFPELEEKAPRVVVYSSISKLETKLDQIGTKGYAVGFKGLVGFIMAQLPQNELIEDALREKRKLIPIEIIRELVANALVHQDFSIGGASVIIEIYTNRVQISNPGEPLVPVDRFLDSDQSRNTRLTELMRRMRICEKKGSGIDRVITAAEVYQLQAPNFWTDVLRTSVSIAGPVEFSDMDRNDRTRACYQHCGLKYLLDEPMTNASLRARFNLKENQSSIASQVISATIDADMIKQDETIGTSRKFARYLPYWA